MPTFEPLVREWYGNYDFSQLSTPWVMFCLDATNIQIYQRYSGLSGYAQGQFLMDRSLTIFRNTMKPLGIAIEWDMATYARSWTTEGLRWEAMAIIFCSIGMATMLSNHNNRSWNLRGMSKSRPEVAKLMLEASMTCLSFCEEIGQLTDPELWVLLDTGYLCSLIEGDGGNMTWRLVGDLVSAVLSRGLHHEAASGPDVPFWLAEMRKRTFAGTYSEDKGQATFLGRPPRLSKRYCAMQLPLDLMMRNQHLSSDELEKQLRSLDQDGWNTGGSFKGAVLSRSGLIYNQIREDILEFSLARTAEVTTAKASELIQQSQSAWDSLPSFIRNGHNLPGPDSWLPRTIRLNFVYNELILQRAMIKRLQHPKNELLSLSRLQLSELITAIQPSYTTNYNAVNIAWLLVKYGLPAAGVLCLELLLEQSGQPNGFMSQHRSEVIQNLSKLVSSLKWSVTRYHGNYVICAQPRDLIQRILDQVLGQPLMFHKSTSEMDQTGEEVGMWSMQEMSELEFWEKLPSHPLLRAAERAD